MEKENSLMPDPLYSVLRNMLNSFYFNSSLDEYLAALSVIQDHDPLTLGNQLLEIVLKIDD